MTSPREIIATTLANVDQADAPEQIIGTLREWGYVIVPKEPTEAIIKAGMVGCTIPERWKAMLAAAKEG